MVTQHPLYNTWSSMIWRCHTNPQPHYGLKGIQVCMSWRNSFEQFANDMGPKPSPELSIDRIDNDGHYEPDNCRWATDLQQARNRGDLHPVIPLYVEEDGPGYLPDSELPYRLPISRRKKTINGGTCSVCGTDLKHKRADAKYCGGACRAAGSRDARAADGMEDKVSVG